MNKKITPNLLKGIFNSISIVLLLIITLTATAATAKSFRAMPISGTVYDENNVPIAGVSVHIKNSTPGQLLMLMEDTH